MIQINVTKQELLIIGKALSEMPYKMVAELLVKIQNQANNQSPAEEPVSKEEVS